MNEEQRSTTTNAQKARTPEVRENGPWWKPAVAVFGEVTGWVVVPIVGALYLGRYFDDKQGTENVYFFIFTGIAFIITSIGIGSIGVKYIRQMEREAKRLNKKAITHGNKRDTD